MIYHNTKNGLPSSILNEQYNPDVIRTYCTKDNKVRREQIMSDVCVTHDMFGSTLSIRVGEEFHVISLDRIIGTTLSIRVGEEFYVISLDRIIEDILEVENENKNLLADR